MDAVAQPIQTTVGCRDAAVYRVDAGRWCLDGLVGGTHKLADWRGVAPRHLDRGPRRYHSLCRRVVLPQPLSSSGAADRHLGPGLLCAAHLGDVPAADPA